MRTLPWILGLALVGCAPVEDDTDATDDPTDDTDGDDTDDTDDTDVDDTDVDDTDDTDVDDTDDTDDTEIEVEWPATSEDYTFEAAVYLSSFDVPGTGPAVACCRDWGAASKNGVGNDNALAGLKSNFAALFDLEEQLDATVESGGFVALLDMRDLPASGTGTFPLGFFLGDYEGDTTYAEASVGEGTFTCDPQSFVGTTGEPQVYFAAASLTDDELLAENGDFAISLALVGISLVVPVQDVTLQGTVTTTPAGVTITEGKLSGVVGVDDFFGAYNDVVDAACGCAGLTGSLFTKGGAGWSGDCSSNDDVADLCTLPDEEICQTLIGNTVIGADSPGVCGLLGTLFPVLADIDTNGSPGSYEGLSVGLRFEGVPADVTGLTP